MVVLARCWLPLAAPSGEDIDRGQPILSLVPMWVHLRNYFDDVVHVNNSVGQVTSSSLGMLCVKLDYQIKHIPIAELAEE